MSGMLLAELAIFAQLYAVRVILFVLDGIVIPLLALGAGQRHPHSHVCLHFHAADGFSPVPADKQPKPEPPGAALGLSRFYPYFNISAWD
jgi:hypothetical protein